LKILDLVYSDSPCMVNEGVYIYIYTSVYIPFLGVFFPPYEQESGLEPRSARGCWMGLVTPGNVWGGGLFFTPGKKYIYNWYLYIYIASRLSSTIILIIVLWLLLVEVEVVEVVGVVVAAAGAGAGGWRGGVVLSSLLPLRNGCMFHTSAGFLPSIVWVCLKHSGSIVGHDEVRKQKMVGPLSVWRHSQSNIHP